MIDNYLLSQINTDPETRITFTKRGLKSSSHQLSVKRLSSRRARA
jgi:hypothetical protein